MCTSEYEQLQCFQESAAASLLWVTRAINEAELWLFYWRQLIIKTLSRIWVKFYCILPSLVSMFSISVQESISTNKILTFIGLLTQMFRVRTLLCLLMFFSEIFLSRTNIIICDRLMEHSYSHRISELHYEIWSYSLYSSSMYIHHRESPPKTFPCLVRLHQRSCFITWKV